MANEMESEEYPYFMDELDFTIEFNSDLQDDAAEASLMSIADSQLRELASGHDDITGAAVNIRKPAKRETAPIHKATVVVYARPENIAATEKDNTPTGALQGALDAVERQVRKKRERLRQTWEHPENEPVTSEVLEVVAADEAADEVDNLLDEDDTD
jgi:ribosome-associated translation inhibitor RaiA